MTPPPHNPVKLPLLVTLVVVIAVEVLVFALGGHWILAAIGAVIIILLVLAVRTIRHGRNPWWTRAPIDRRQARRRTP